MRQLEANDELFLAKHIALLGCQVLISVKRETRAARAMARIFGASEAP
ncbi:hypothetical protein ACSFBM_20045 [Variovorax sp. GB1R11]